MTTKETDVKELRERAGMTRAQFCDFFGLPYRTLQNWELGERKCAEWILDLMAYKLEAEGWIR